VLWVIDKRDRASHSPVAESKNAPFMSLVDMHREPFESVSLVYINWYRLCGCDVSEFSTGRDHHKVGQRMAYKAFEDIASRPVF